MPKTSEWFKISILCNNTDHKRAPDLVSELEAFLRAKNFKAQVEFSFWGDEPKKPRFSDGRRGGLLG